MLAQERQVIAELNNAVAEVACGWCPALAGAAVADQPEGQDVGGCAVQGHRAEPPSSWSLRAQDTEWHWHVRRRSSSEDNSKNHPQL